MQFISRASSYPSNRVSLFFFCRRGRQSLPTPRTKVAEGRNKTPYDRRSPGAPAPTRPIPQPADPAVPTSSNSAPASRQRKRTREATGSDATAGPSTVPDGPSSAPPVSHRTRSGHNQAQKTPASPAKKARLQTGREPTPASQLSGIPTPTSLPNSRSNIGAGMYSSSWLDSFFFSFLLSSVPSVRLFIYLFIFGLRTSH